MIKQYLLQGTSWIKISSAGVRIRAWIDEDYDDAQGSMDVRFWTEDTEPSAADFTKARRLYGLNSNYDPMVQESHSDVSYFWARCRNTTDKARISVEELAPTTVIANIGAGDRNTDTFGRLPVSLPKAVSEFQNEYNETPLAWEHYTSGTGVITHISAESSVLLSTGGTAVGARALRQTRQYGRYRPGRSKLLIFTGVLGAPTLGSKRMAGIYDDYNGCFFLAKDGIYYLVIRSSTTGSVVDREIPQSEWNGNKIEGSGRGGIAVDPTNTLLGWIDLEWLGVGQVRFGIVYEGKFILCHSEDHVNRQTKAYMATANLPIRYEVVNHGPSPATEIATLKSICAVMLEEGDGDQIQGYDRATGSGDTLRAITQTSTIVLALRQKLTFQGKVNRSLFKIKSISGLAEKGSVLLRLLYNPTLTGGTWSSVGPNSTTEKNTTATSFSDGIVVAEVEIPASNQSKGAIEATIDNFFPLTVNYLGTESTVWAVEAKALTTTSADVRASISWKEVY